MTAFDPLMHADVEPRNPRSASVESVADSVFGDIYADHGVSVFRLALMLTGDRYVAEEVTAEVFARVLPKWRCGAIDDPVVYLRRAAVNEVRSRFRRRANERRALARHASRSATELRSADLGVADESLLLALSQLPIRQRAVIVLRFHDDLSVTEVAHLIGIPQNTVKTLTRRALSTLRTQMENSR